MARCINCWWADFNPQNPMLHQISMEPDYTAKMKPGGIPPEVRVVKTCGKGQFWFQGHNPVEHKCEHFLLFAIGKHDQERADKAKVEGWSTPTQRKQLPPVQNAFVVMGAMAENNEAAYNALVDFIGLNDMEGLTWTIFHLNDMNIRGDQINHALKFAGGDIKRLQALATERSEDMVAYVNENYEHSDKEEAVKEGAARFGHKKTLKLKKK